MSLADSQDPDLHNFVLEGILCLMLCVMQHYCLVILKWCKFNPSISLELIVLLLLSCACCPAQISSLVNASRNLVSSTKVTKLCLPSLPYIYHIGLGGGGKEFLDIKLWEREVLDTELENREVLTFSS